MSITLHIGDIPADLDLGNAVAIDTETMGLNLLRDRLCLVQLSTGDGSAHLVQFKDSDFSAPNLKKMLSNPAVQKIFHFGRFDIAAIWMYLDVLVTNVYCTKIASKLVRTYTDAHGLKANCSTVLGVDLAKHQQTSDWGADELTQKQLEYAASDVLHLHKLRDELNKMLKREGREELAKSCFNFLPTRALLDVSGWGDQDIFAH